MIEREMLDPGRVHEKALKGDALSHALWYVFLCVEPR